MQTAKARTIFTNVSANLVTNAMDAEITNKVQVEINITKAE